MENNLDNPNSCKILLKNFSLCPNKRNLVCENIENVSIEECLYEIS